MNENWCWRLQGGFKVALALAGMLTVLLGAVRGSQLLLQAIVKIQNCRCRLQQGLKMGPITYSADFYVKIYHTCHALNCILSCYLLKNNGKLQHVKLYLNISYMWWKGGGRVDTYGPSPGSHQTIPGRIIPFTCLQPSWGMWLGLNRRLFLCLWRGIQSLKVHLHKILDFRF